MITVWTEEVGPAGSYHAQVMKLADGTAEGHQLIAGGSDYGLYVDVRRFTSGSMFTTGCLDRLTSACIDRITAGSIGKASIDQTTHGTTNRVAVHGGVTVSQTPTITTSAYVAADAVGGKLTFANAARVSAGKGIVNTVTVIDNDKENAVLRLWLFNQDFTATGDADAFDPSDADLANCSGVVPIETADYYSANDNSVACVRGVGLQYQLTGTSLYAQLQAPGTPTFSASTDLTVKLSLEFLD